MGTMDELIDPELVRRLGRSMRRVTAGAGGRALTEAERSVAGRKLRQRVDIVRDALLEDVPGDFATTARITHGLLELPDFTGWMIWPASEWVARRALESGSVSDFDAAMELLAELTIRLSSEFAVRDLLVARPARALRIMQAWTEHPNEHVRRLASEGSRAYLPWGRRVPWLIAHPDSTHAIVDALYRDVSEYVRRSVANHVNDLSRVDPAGVTRLAARWVREPDDHTPWVVRHALRTLIKKGDPTALELVGFTGTNLLVSPPELSARSVAWNGSLSFSATIVNEGQSEAQVAIDYSIGFRRANGTIRAKTFKLASRRIPPGKSVVVDTSHSFRPITTRAYYPGEHFVTVQANGLVSSEARFVLEPDRAAVEQSAPGHQGVAVMESVTDRVIEIVQSIPPGRVMTYGAVARAVGTGARVVGRVVHDGGHEIPWWRVVDAEGRPYGAALEDARARFLEEGTPLRLDRAATMADLATASWPADGEPFRRASPATPRSG